MCDACVRERLVPVLEALSLPTTAVFDKEHVIEAIRHDKKLSGEYINAVWVNKIGSFEFKKVPMSDFENRLREVP